MRLEPLEEPSAFEQYVKTTLDFALALRWQSYQWSSESDPVTGRVNTHSMRYQEEPYMRELSRFGTA